MAPVEKKLSWWASEERWFNRDLPTRACLLVVYATARALDWFERAVTRS